MCQIMNAMRALTGRMHYKGERVDRFDFCQKCDDYEPGKVEEVEARQLPIYDPVTGNPYSVTKAVLSDSCMVCGNTVGVFMKNVTT